MSNIFEDYYMRYPQLEGLKTDKQFNEEAASSFIEFLAKNKAAGIGYIQDIAKGMQEHLELVKGQLALNWKNENRPTDILEAVIYNNKAKIEAIAMLLSISDMYDAIGQVKDMEAYQVSDEYAAEQERFANARSDAHEY